jgi:CSLREA domain-containing protein
MKSILDTSNKFRFVLITISMCLFILIIGNLNAEGAVSIIDWYPDPVNQGDLVTFESTSSYDSYKWWISDGPGTTCTLTDSPDSENSTYQYTFYENGDWQICFEGREYVEGEPDIVSIDAQYVTVNNHEPEIADPFYWDATPEPSEVGQSFHVEVPFMDYEDISAYSCTIDYGDGSEAVGGSIQHDWDYVWLCVGPSHTYTASNDLIFVTATIYDDYPDSYSTSEIYYHEVIASTAYLTVNATDDESDGACDATHCNLREAISAATSGDTITFASNLSGAMITLGSQLTIDKNLTIDGSTLTERVTLSGNNSIGVFNILSGTVTLDSLIITEGSTWEGGGIISGGNLTLKNSVVSNSVAIDSFGSRRFGGGIYNYGNLTIVNSVIKGNSALEGGGLYNDQFEDYDGTPYIGIITVIDSTIEDNQAEKGGGIYNVSQVTLSGSTMIGNMATSVGGGLVNDVGATMKVANCTFTENSADLTAHAISNFGTLNLFNSTLSHHSGLGSTLVNATETAELHLANTIIANTTGGAEDCKNHNYGVIETNVNNLIQNTTTCNPEYTGDPLLSPLADNGGPTHTMALLPGSPAIDAGDDTVCAGEEVGGVDQRGVTRPQGSHCDIGAYEYEGVQPQTLVVNSTGDAGDETCDETCTLRDAVLSANSGDTITFAESLSGSTITLGGHIWINKDLTIEGPGADQLTISGGEVEHYIYNDEGDDVGGVFLIRGGYVGGSVDYISVEISGLTITDGRARDGGGIHNGSRSTLELTDCVIGPNNAALDAGGGISNKFGTLTLNRCTVWGNSQIGGGDDPIGGGGIVTINSPATTTLINSTVSGNEADGYGGGILSHSSAEVNLSYTTITDNAANQHGGGVAIGESGTVQSLNSILADNFDTSSAETDSNPDVFGTFTSLGGNLIGDGTGSSGWDESDKVGTDTSPLYPMLGALTVNEPGKTPTMALLTGSPAIDAVACPAEVTTDQRGIGRPQGDLCDIGAYEVEQAIDETAALTWLQANTSITGDLDALIATFPDSIPPVIVNEDYVIDSRMTLAEALPTGTTVTVYRESTAVLTDITLTGVGPFWFTELFEPDESRAAFDAGYGGAVEHYQIVITGPGDNPLDFDTTLKIESVISKDGYATETVLATLDLIPVHIAADETAALAWLQANTSITGDLDALTATFPVSIPPVIVAEDYVIDSRMTLAEALPTGTTVTVYREDTAVLTDITLTGVGPFWFTELFEPDASRAAFDAGYGGAVEHYQIVITGPGDNPLDFDTTLKIESVISKDGYTTETVLADLDLIPVHIDAVLGDLRISKVFETGDSGFSGYFTIHYDCGTVYTDKVDLAAGESHTIYDIPIGTQCTVTEPSLPTAPPGWSFGIPTYNPADGTVTISETIAEVTVTNTISQDAPQLGALRITKAFDPLTSEYKGNFRIHYNCGTEIYGFVDLEAGESLTHLNIPIGTVCTVTEPVLPEAPEGWSFGTPTFSPSGTVTIDAPIVEVTVTNSISKVSQLVSARTKCSLFASGDAMDLPSLMYTPSYNKKTGDEVIKSVTPSTFLYYVKATLPADASTLVIAQGNDSFFPAMGASVTLYDENCVRLSPQLATVSITEGNITINVVEGTGERVIIAAVKYTAKPVIGQIVNGYPDILFTFSAALNSTEPFTRNELVLRYIP